MNSNARLEGGFFRRTLGFEADELQTIETATGSSTYFYFHLLFEHLSFVAITIYI